MFIETKNLNKSFEDCQAAKDISFGVEKGKMAALLGPSGSGKTTILRIIAGLEQQDSGDVFIDGENVNEVPAGKREIGFVFQNYALFRHMSVYENIAFGLRVLKMDRKAVDERVRELIKLIGLEGLEKRYPNQLSGGQCQRVAFARAIAPNPRLLLLDEPFAAIDAKVRKELRVWLKNMIAQVGITSIFVTHDQEEALDIADEIVIINQGHLEQVGSPEEIYLHPRTPFVAEFAGNSLIFDSLNGYRGFENLPSDGKFIIRPEFVDAFKPDNPEMQHLMDRAEDGVITSIRFLGDSLELSIKVNDLQILTHRSLERRNVEVGEHLKVFLYRVYCIEKDKTQVYENTRLSDVELA